ncbi:hypothetical protein AAG570_012256 [Ranatra chinensis]|uniref:Uncharacterized protein n=1 Tax=Ranatra chinensis TaxID=642074 RepID=A0ABD0Z4K7_9HEMI
MQRVPPLGPLFWLVVVACLTRQVGGILPGPHQATDICSDPGCRCDRWSIVFCQCRSPTQDIASSRGMDYSISCSEFAVRFRLIAEMNCGPDSTAEDADLAATNNSEQEMTDHYKYTFSSITTLEN